MFTNSKFNSNADVGCFVNTHRHIVKVEFDYFIWVEQKCQALEQKKNMGIQHYHKIINKRILEVSSAE